MSSPVRPKLRLAALLGACVLAVLAAANPAAGAGLPASCVHEKHTSTGAVDPNGLCVSLGYGVRPAGQPTTTPSIHNVLTYAQNGEALPSDYYVRSDVAAQIAAGTARPRATYLLFYGGAYICGSRADVATHAREIARRGYVAIATEYPLAGTLRAYGNYKPHPGYNQGQLTTAGVNPCGGFDDWIKTPLWKNTFLPKFTKLGLEPALAEAQRSGQILVRHLRTYAAAYGIDPKRIFAMGWSAGGSVALRLALGGDDDVVLNKGVDPGDSTIAGAVSISGPACYPGSRQVTTPMLGGQLIPSKSPACRFSASKADPTILMLQEPRGGKDDAYIPSEMMLGSCAAINAVARGRCVYEDRPAGKGGYLSDGDHAYITWPNFLKLLDALAAQGVGRP